MEQNQGGEAVSDTPRTDNLLTAILDAHGFVHKHNCPPQWVMFARELERELNAANDRIKSLIEERDRANRLADWKWNLRGEFESLLGTDNIEDGIKAVKEMLYQIKLLEEASNIRLSLITKLEGEIDELNHRIKRLEDAGDLMVQHFYTDEPRSEMWEKAKEAKP
jgi:hypothetical protein